MNQTNHSARHLPDERRFVRTAASEPLGFAARGIQCLARGLTGPTPETMLSKQLGNILLYRSFFTNLRLTNARSMRDQHRRIAALIETRQNDLGAAP